MTENLKDLEDAATEKALEYVVAMAEHTGNAVAARSFLQAIVIVLQTEYPPTELIKWLRQQVSNIEKQLN